MLGPGTLEGQLWARCHRENPLCPSSAALNQPLPFRLSPHLQAQTHFHRRVGSGDTLGEGCDWIGTCRGHTRAVWATPLSGPHLPGRPCCRNVPRAVFPLLRPLPPAMAASLLRACSLAQTSTGLGACASPCCLHGAPSIPVQGQRGSKTCSIRHLPWIWI